MQVLWYLAYESSSNAAPDSAMRASAGATIDGWRKRVKTNGRVEVSVEVLESARQDLAERVSDASDLSCVRRNRMTRFNNPSQTLQTIKQYFIGSPSIVTLIHSGSAYGSGSRCCAESVYPEVRLTGRASRLI